MRRQVTMLLPWLAMLAAAGVRAGDDIPPQHRIGSVLEGLSPDVLFGREGRPASVDLSHQPVWELYPRVDLPRDWRIEVGYVQQRSFQYLEWQAVPIGIHQDGRPLPARRIAEGVLVLAELSTARERRLLGWSLRPAFRGFGSDMVTGADWRVVWRGSQGPVFDAIEELVFSRDGKHLAYLGRRGVEWYVVVDGHQWGPFEAARYPTFSADGRHAAFGAQQGARWRVYQDGRAGAEYSQVGRPLFSPDGTGLAYRALDGSRWRVVRRDQPGKDYDTVGRPLWSPDGRHLVHTAVRGGEHFLVVDGKPEAAYTRVEQPVFSRSGRLAYLAADGGKTFVVCDGEAGPVFDVVDFPAFGPGDRLAYRARRGGEWFLVVDDRPGPAFEMVDEPHFGPRPGQVAWVARRELRPFLVVGGQAVTGTFDWLGRLRFSKDGKRLGFGAMKDGETWWRVVELP